MENSINLDAARLFTKASRIVNQGASENDYITDGDLDILEQWFAKNGYITQTIIVNAAFRMKGIYGANPKHMVGQYEAVAALIMVALSIDETTE